MTGANRYDVVIVGAGMCGSLLADQLGANGWRVLVLEAGTGTLGTWNGYQEAVATMHRWSGRVAFLCTLPVFFHCVTILGFQAPDARVAIHSLLGTFLYGVFVAKVLIVRDRSLPAWALPAAGLTLASMLVAIWLSSSLWYFTTVRFGF